MANPLVEKVLEYLSHTESVDSLQLSREWEEDHQKIVGAIKSIQSAGEIIEVEQRSELRTELTNEGKEIADKGSHEALVFNLVPSGDDGILLNDLMKLAGSNGKIGMNKAMQAGWVKMVKEKKTVVRQKEEIEDKVQESLKEIAKGKNDLDGPTLQEFKKRKLIVQNSVAYLVIRKGPGFTTTIEKQETELTPEMLASGDWQKKNFKAYNFEALGAPVQAGHLHPLMKVRAEFRSILFEMGFSEMPTNRFVESSFWNFDALFVPQKHPARDAQDTFFVSQPATCNSFPEEFMEKVKAAHEGGSYGSSGYGAEWKKEETVKNVMRTHTTAISARLLYQIGQQKEFVPTKLFSIDRVFRNETLDATHLAEFHQVEGVVADRGVNLGHLIGIMKEFFSRLGIRQLRFKPAYNPYTEPSMEVFAFHEGLKKWVEVGNSGMFRPEMLLPMGLPEDVNVIAWGLSLERPTMIRYGIDNIRDLVGHKVDLGMVYKSPICRLDKHPGGNSFSNGSAETSSSSLTNVMSGHHHQQVRNVDKTKTRLQVIANHLSTPKTPNKEEEEEDKETSSQLRKSNMSNINPLTSHVLDTSRGRPAAGILVKFYKQQGDGNWLFITEQHTNSDGRIGNLISSNDFTVATYKLRFDTETYFLGKGEKTFYPYIEIVFRIEHPGEHYHVPILLSAYGFSTYRGS